MHFMHLCKTLIFCNIINVFTVTFDEFNASLLSTNFLKKNYFEKIALAANFLTVIDILLCSVSIFK